MSADPLQQVSTTSPRTSVAHCWLTAPVYKQLEVEADRLGKHPDRLVADLVTAVLLHGFTDAVLHER